MYSEFGGAKQQSVLSPLRASHRISATDLSFGISDDDAHAVIPGATRDCRERDIYFSVVHQEVGKRAPVSPRSAGVPGTALNANFALLRCAADK